MLTTEQVLKRLSEEGITENIQMVRRWIRQGDLPATAPVKRKDGYLVSEADLNVFIESKRKNPKRTADEYEAEIQQLRGALEQSQAENVRLRNELERSEERYNVLSSDLHDALDKLADNKKDGMANWKRKYDEAIKRGREKTNMLIAAEQE
ncbi:helix-turn-helix domain-containing protein, partial [Brevibacillus laterosporus]|nr:helix-turn-helix domain-containing protein [Brevibacillus laterosporus]